MTYDEKRERCVPDPEFWALMVKTHALSEELAEEFQNVLTKTPWMPLGAILVSEGFLKIREVTGLLSIQEKEPNERIGDLAVREGYCTRQQIEAAVRIQQRACPGAIDLILRDVPDGDATTRALVGYIHYLEARVTQLIIRSHEKAAA
ncbi:MAG: hypothetical protein R3F33_00185 [Planctomycetota bacterium]